MRAREQKKKKDSLDYVTCDRPHLKFIYNFAKFFKYINTCFKKQIFFFFNYNLNLMRFNACFSSYKIIIFYTYYFFIIYPVQKISGYL